MFFWENRRFSPLEGVNWWRRPAGDSQRALMVLPGSHHFFASCPGDARIINSLTRPRFTMHEDSAAFRNMISRLQQGDVEAAQELYDAFVNRLIRLARERLPRSLQQKLDPEDVVQSAMRSFFGRLRAGEFQLRDRHSLWSLLALITLRKCGHKVKYYLAGCRDLRRELQQWEVPSGKTVVELAAWEALARDPNPAELAEIVDTVEYLMRRLNRNQRRIVMLRLQGYTTAEIAQELGKSQRSVQLVLETARDILIAQLKAASEESDSS